MLSFRSLLVPIVAIGLPIAAAVWSVSTSKLERADFTFNNETEIESVDPAVVTGKPEGRIIWALFEGLVKLDSKTRLPTKRGVAEDWDISEDGKTYTWHLREEARWSNGDPVTAEDFRYSLRRFLHPLTASQYSYQAWYIEKGEEYSKGGDGIEPGDPVEVELNLSRGQHDTLIGELLFGTLISKDPAKMPDDEEERKRIRQTFVVEIDGKQRTFTLGDPRYGDEPPEGGELCRNISLDFAEVGVEVIDDHTFVTRLKNPTPYWPQLMGFYPLSPVHRGCLEEHGAPAWTQPGNIVTNGPFVIDLRRPRDRIRLRKSETYWNRDKIKLNTIDALTIDDDNTALNMYEAGEIEWIPQLSGEFVRDIQNADPPRNDFHPAKQLTVYYYKLNTARKPLDQKKVRQALALALDREEFVRAITQTGEEPALHLVPPGIPGYESPMLGPPDVARAKQLLKEAGFEGGEGFPRLEILYNTNESHKAIAELARKQWQNNLGITVTLQNEAWASTLNRLRLMKYDIGRQAWTGDYVDPVTWLDMYVTDGENNQTGWSNEEYDKLIEKAKKTADPEERLGVLREAEELLMDEMPIIPIYFYVCRPLIKPYVRGIDSNPLDAHPLEAIWIDEEAKAEYAK